MTDSPFYQQVVRRIAALVEQAAPDLSRPPGILVALSGGPDSVAGLLAVCRWADAEGGIVEAAHLNHGLRGQEAQADETFCRRLCSDLDVQLHVRHRDPKAEAALRNRGLEEAGRILRHRFLAGLLLEHAHLDCVATGHHLDDQAETILLRLFRGTGLDGLRGIQERTGFYIRPLLHCTRAEILEFLGAEGQAYCIDSTNQSRDNRRSRVRRELLPLARDIFGDGADKVPARLADLVGADLELLDRMARHALERIRCEAPQDQGGRVSAAATPDDRLAVAPLLELDKALARRVLRLFMLEVRGSIEDLSLQHVDELLAWLEQGQSGGQLDWVGGWQIVREFDQLLLLPPAVGAPAPSAVSNGTNYHILVHRNEMADANGAARGPRRKNEPAAGGSDTAPTAGWRLECPVAAIRGSLRLRRWQAGDRIKLLGLGGRKKISDLLRERRVGVTARPQVMVVEDDLGILWVVGLAQAERTRMLPDTELKVTIQVIAADQSEGKDTVLDDA